MIAALLDNVPRVCACPECLGTALDDSPLCGDCTRTAGSAPVAAWRGARDELRAAIGSGEARVARVWQGTLLDCEDIVVRAAMGRARTLPADGYTGPLLFGACA